MNTSKRGLKILSFVLATNFESIGNADTFALVDNSAHRSYLTPRHHRALPTQLARSARNCAGTSLPGQMRDGRAPGVTWRIITSVAGGT